MINYYEIWLNINESWKQKIIVDWLIYYMIIPYISILLPNNLLTGVVSSSYLAFNLITIINIAY